MIKVLIVDDELIVRIGLKSILEWEKYGYKVIGEAADGEEALELIKKQRPDIVMTDLVMSPKDGFWLIAECREKYPDIHLVVLSSYNDGENVKKAMKLGAEDYLFKLKVTQESVLELLNELSSKDGKTKEKRKADPSHFPAVRQQLLSRLLERSYIDLYDLDMERERLGLQVSYVEPAYMCLVCIDDFKLMEKEVEVKETDLLRFSIMNIMQEVYAGSFLADYYHFEDGILVLIRNNGMPLDQTVRAIQEHLEVLNRHFMTYLGLTASCVVGKAEPNLREAGHILTGLRKKLAQRIVKGRSYYVNLTYQKQTNTQHNKKNQNLLKDLDFEVEKALDKGETNAQASLNSIFERIASLGLEEEKDIRRLYFDLYYAIIKYMKRRGCFQEDLYTQEETDLYQVLLYADTASRIGEAFHDVLTRLFKWFVQSERQQPRSDIVKVKEYIKEHLSEELTVQTMADMLQMNGSYFSHIFKKETSYNFVDYVNRQRIEKAQELISTSDLHIYEISKQVGIENANYFSILYKKLTGRTPNDKRRWKTDD